MANVRGGLVHYVGACYDCGQEFHSRNVLGLAAQHAQRYGHQVMVELGHHYQVTPDGVEPDRSRFVGDKE